MLLAVKRGVRITPSASRGGLTTKINAVVDESGLPVRLALTPGQASCKATAPALLEGLPAAPLVVADRSYDWQHLIDLVDRRGGQAQIPTQRSIDTATLSNASSARSNTSGVSPHAMTSSQGISSPP